MVKYRDTEAKTSTAKRTISVTGVSIVGNELCDEDGNIAGSIADMLPSGIDSFDLKIVIELPTTNEE